MREKINAGPKNDVSSDGPILGIPEGPALSVSSGTIRPGALHQTNTSETQLPARLALQLVDVRDCGGSVEQFWIDAAKCFERGVLPVGLKANVERHADRIQHLALRFSDLAEQHQDAK